MSSIHSGKYWSNITAIYEKQRQKGIVTYGQTLEENNKLSDVELIEMAQEEAIDLLMYLEKLKERLKDGKTNN